MKLNAWQITIIICCIMLFGSAIFSFIEIDSTKCVVKYSCTNTLGDRTCTYKVTMFNDSEPYIDVTITQFSEYCFSPRVLN
jgi:hypothetical protein